MTRHLPRLRARLPRVLVLAALGLLCSSGIAQAETGNAATPPPGPACAQGEFCAWAEEFYGGQAEHVDLRNANPEECIPLPGNLDARSFANRMAREVTIYQDRDCSTEGDFTTYPGGGTFVPQSRFLVRAIQIWN
ncbi:peptidase inhibitor family I36 protein [Amycolatopsis anabasis]|uniref:peptidase inhibitor family I36 protein n=1 Tax=Amycolatopsis anabasis TaxID=1840409 RepID=UPI00131E45BF|nr:peptidase inhibitor family I36 protein [Amycolatopsis anabasis]